MKNLFVAGFLVATALSSCQPNHINGTHTPPPAQGNGLAPVETKNPNTDYKPAFSGQTRISGVKTQTSLNIKVLNQSLGRPWGISELPDGRFLITEKSGFIYLVSPDGLNLKKITGFPAVDASGQGGMLDVVADENFDANRILFWVFSEKVNGGNHTAVAKGNLSADESRIENAQVIYRAEPTYDGRLHYGSRVLIDKSGHLVISTGERSDLATRPQAQQLNSALGKIIKIDRNGKPAPGNPFLGQSDKRPEIFSYGHRNPQGIAFHPETGDLWEAEMGPRGGDEINLITAGRNYGWPTITYGIEYSGAVIGGAETQRPGMEQPVYYWDPSVSPSGIDFYRGSTIPEWKNNLFVACLSGQHIIRLILTTNKVTGEERLLETENERFRDVYSARNGNLYAITDSGKLYQISKK